MLRVACISPGHSSLTEFFNTLSDLMTHSNRPPGLIPVNGLLIWFRVRMLNSAMGTTLGSVSQGSHASGEAALPLTFCSCVYADLPRNLGGNPGASGDCILAKC